MDQLPSVVLKDPTSSLTATYVPAAGMVCTSLTDDGVELLGQRSGLKAHISDGKTMGIPFLYPWANRLSANTYDVAGRTVTVTPGSGGVHPDQHGQPIHGLLIAYPGWRLTEQTANHLSATVDFSADAELLAGYPVPHIVELDIRLVDRALTVRTTVTPTSPVSVPLCFGFHPYLVIPDVPREQWRLVTLPMRHLQVDGFGIPTGAAEFWPDRSELLEDKTYDDGFDEVQPAAVFALSGGDRTIEVFFESGYPTAQIYAPDNDDVVAIEPMAAPTNALRQGNHRSAVPGCPAVAVFSIRVG